MPNLNELWQAHKLRNQIAHEPNFKLKRDLAERALGIYETALRIWASFKVRQINKIRITVSLRRKNVHSLNSDAVFYFLLAIG